MGFMYFTLEENLEGENISKGYANDDSINNQLQKHPYIRNINYVTFPARKSVEVSIELKKDVAENAIAIQLNDEDILFKKNSKNIFVQIKENGEYIVTIDNTKFKFKIDNIDEFAPELVEVQNHNNYLQLIINDEMSQLDYEQSYFEYKNEKYEINQDSIIQGNFNGEVSIVLFNKEGLFIRYIVVLI
jgi:hypothetical protein